MGLPKLHAQLPSLRMLTQAGGRLREELVRYFGTACVEHMVQFFVMYGQTEASPRISYVPPERLLDKVGSIGIPIPGGRMYVDSTNGELVMTWAGRTKYTACLEPETWAGQTTKGSTSSPDAPSDF
jgi:acyl-CoA synthetase (AMP-forming)/AMP-acid ligase II